MARQRVSLLNAMESLIMKIQYLMKRFFSWKGYRSLMVMLLVVTFLLTSGVVPVRSQWSQAPLQVSADGKQLDENARKSYEAGDYFEAIKQSQRAYEIFKFQNDWQNQAVSLTNRGLSQFALGQPESAFQSWKAVEEIYNQYADKENPISQKGIVKARIYQAQALREAGLSYQACDTLLSVVISDNSLSCDRLEKTFVGDKNVRPIGEGDDWQKFEYALKEVSTDRNKFLLDPNLREIFIRNFGENLRILGKLDESEAIFCEELTHSQSKDCGESDIIHRDGEALHLSLANTLRAQGILERDRQSPPQYEYIPWRYLEHDEFHVDDKSSEEYKKKMRKYSKADSYYRGAIHQYQMAAQSKSKNIRFQAKINLLSLLVERKGTANRIQQIRGLITELKEYFSANTLKTRFSAYSRINFAKSLVYLAQQDPQLIPQTEWDIAFTLIQKARTISEEIKDARAWSYALGNLAGLYEYCNLQNIICQQHSSSESLNESKILTSEALIKSQPSAMPDIAYQWQWQLGRLARRKPETEQSAIAYYESAIKTLESARGNLRATTLDTQFSFRDNVEPIYRELVSLLLPSDTRSSISENREKALYYVESLQITELENVLKCNLKNLRTLKVNWSSDKNNFITNFLDRNSDSALLYPILLKDRIAVMLKSKGTNLQYQSTAQVSSFLGDNINHVQMTIEKSLKDLKRAQYRVPPSDLDNPLYKLHSWIVAPFQSTLEQEKIKNLIFVLDSSLRKVPMSALYDGKKFLAQEDFTVSVSPSVQLLESTNSKPNKNRFSKVLVAGAVEERKGFDSNGWVTEQISLVKNQFKNSKVLSFGSPKDEKFTKKKFQQAIQYSSYDIVHLATHGKFSSDPKQTFILTDDKSDYPRDYSININEFGKIFRSTGRSISTIDLLVLSACQTADGDSRAVLGIAGLSVRTKANSTLAPLWKVDQDSSTLFLKEFYKNLVESGMSKREALHYAQKEFLDRPNKLGYDAPYHWAAFVLIGS
jgi:CHAT domain-containing protein